LAADAPRPAGVVAGHAEGAKAGREILDAGGNAVDAVVAAGLAVAAAAPQLCGLGGYGGHLTAATDGGKTVTAIDLNTAGPAAAAKSTRPHLLKDPASAALLLVNAEPPAIGQVMRNPDLAALLEKLAERNSVDAFYRGDVARTIATEFRKHGGLVTEADLAA